MAFNRIGLQFSFFNCLQLQHHLNCSAYWITPKEPLHFYFLIKCLDAKLLEQITWKPTTVRYFLLDTCCYMTQVLTTNLKYWVLVYWLFVNVTGLFLTCQYFGQILIFLLKFFVYWQRFLWEETSTSKCSKWMWTHNLEKICL